MQSIELLSPARNLECGIEAIRHGADAIYIGAPRFGARAAAGNSVEDIARLVDYAKPFGVRIYVTFNTLLHDDEFPAAQALINDLAAIPVDALIVQDPRILPTPPVAAPAAFPAGGLLSPLPLHSSTQMDNRTIADVRARFVAGYQQTVLARELSLEEIRAIHTAVPQMPLEVFIHGALCVSYSGCCYASEYCFNRSANRGECAQFCRLPFDLVDSSGQVVTVLSGAAEGFPLRQRHLLSLRDMNRATDLEALMDAGVSSFKIEGRLKDVSYVKNITAYYRQRIDAIISRRPAEFCRPSRGVSTISFTPNPLKSFNRGFTDYFLHSGTASATPSSQPLHQHLTPKSLGEPIGTVKEITSSSGAEDRWIGAGGSRGDAELKNAAGKPRRTNTTDLPPYFTLLPSTASCHLPQLASNNPVPLTDSSQLSQLADSTPAPSPINNGDGLCFFTPDGHLQGFRINRADERGRLYPADPSVLKVLRRGTPLFRNLDAAFERQLTRPTADRRIPVCWLLEDSASFYAPQEPSSPSTAVPSAFEGFHLTLSEATPSAYEAHPFSVTFFFPHPLEPARTPQADNLRRQLLRLGDTPFSATEADITLHLSDNWFIPASTLADWRREMVDALRSLLSNKQTHPLTPPCEGGEQNESNYKLSSHQSRVNESTPPLMTCRYCLRQALGFCTKAPVSKQPSPKEPLFLRLADGRRFPLHFDCKNCLMFVLTPDT